MSMEQLLRQYNQTRDAMLSLSGELDKLRAQIARKIVHNYRGRDGHVCAYDVRETRVRSHVRRGYRAVRITGKAKP